MTEPLRLSGDVKITGYTGKLRVARNEEGTLQYEEVTRKIHPPEQREWEHVVDDWSGGMGLARLPAGQFRTKRYYYSKNFDPTAPGILRPSPAVNTLALSVAPQSASAIRNGFEERIGTKDYVYLLLYNSAAMGGLVAKIDNSAATPVLIEIRPYGLTGYFPGQPVKAYDADKSAERWYVPVGKDGDNSFAWNLETTSDPTTLTSNDTEQSNFVQTVFARILHGTQTATTGPLDWTLGASKLWATAGMDFNPSGGSPPTVDADTLETSEWYLKDTETVFPNFNTGSGSDKCLVVCMAGKGPGTPAIKFGAFQLTLGPIINAGGLVGAGIYYLEGVTGTEDIVLVPIGGFEGSLTAFVLNGVNQATPTTGDTTATGTSTAPSVNPTLGTNDLGVALVGVADYDTWAKVDMANEGARHFQRVGPIIWKADNFNRVSAFAIGPTNSFEEPTNWGANTSVGQSGLAITGLATLGRSLYVAKPEGLFGVDENGEQIDMIPEIDGDPYARFAKGFGVTSWHGRLWYPAGNQGAWYHDLAFHRDIGPDSMGENLGDEPSLSNQIRFGWHAGFRPTAKWLYNLYAPDTSNLYVMVAREIEDSDEVPASYRVVWHPIFFLSSSLTTPAEATVFISHRGYQPRLWFLTSTSSVSYVGLAADGSLYEPDGDRGVAQYCQMWEAETDMGYPGTLKYLREAEAILEDAGDADALWTLHWYHDGSIERSFSGSTFYASGSTIRSATPGTNDTFRRIRFSEKCAIGGALTNEAVSLRRVVYRGGFLPDTGFVVKYVFDVGAEMADSEGVFDERPVEAKIAALKALLMGQVRTLTDHRGIERYVVVEDAQAVSPQSLDLEPGRSLVAITMAEVEYS